MQPLVIDQVAQLVKNGHFTKWLSDLTYILTADEVKERYDSFSPLLDEVTQDDSQNIPNLESFQVFFIISFPVF
jgi:hypothetical protein